MALWSGRFTVHSRLFMTVWRLLRHTTILVLFVFILTCGAAAVDLLLDWRPFSLGTRRAAPGVGFSPSPCPCIEGLAPFGGRYDIASTDLCPSVLDITGQYCELLPTLQGLYRQFSEPPPHEVADSSIWTTQSDLNRHLAACSNGRDSLSRIVRLSDLGGQPPEAGDGGNEACGLVRSRAVQKLHHGLGAALLGHLTTFQDGLPSMAAMATRHQLHMSVLRCVRRRADVLLNMYGQMADILEFELGAMSHDCRDGLQSPLCRNSTVDTAKAVHARIGREIFHRPEHRQTIEAYLGPPFPLPGRNGSHDAVRLP
ncbi:hypothetical protein AYL99_05177 [Fonsecaea erecta]|uniref:Uncharacterized protein n=1 Tax=Fonsecaea erecta TaxID=1367422 RepID=A0A178ZMD0_9EURO|nr:hypothetical protein AYL99_05177 [Fonsecaea erecta]OAP60175.1 hypothetical protein AYL99_05177 [Fonsecaea erecta]